MRTLVSLALVVSLLSGVPGGVSLQSDDASLFHISYAEETDRPSAGKTGQGSAGETSSSAADQDAKEGNEEERKQLFALYAEIELTENKQKKLLYDIQRLKKEIKQLQKEIVSLEEESSSLLEEYAELLRARQKLGMGVNVASLLASKGLRDFLYRASALNEITRGVDDLNSRIIASMDAVEDRKKRTEESLNQVFERNKELKETLASMKKAAADLEKYLEQKGEERAAAEAELALIEAQWKELKHTFEQIVKDVTGIIERGGLPRESVELQVGFTGVSVIVREANFNKVLKEFLQKNHPEIAPMEFKLGDGGVYVRFPSHDVELFGHFEVENQSMRYIVERGKYRDMEMPQSSLDDLFLNREMVFNFQTLVGKSKLKSCTIHEGYIKIDVDLKL